ncbi:MAG: hypothetical protein LCH82_18810 [Actinobacteria bacterium]|nr:hypothetical protein [Actinomycetota bacterium]
MAVVHQPSKFIEFSGASNFVLVLSSELGASVVGDLGEVFGEGRDEDDGPYAAWPTKPSSTSSSSCPTTP